GHPGRGQRGGWWVDRRDQGLHVRLDRGVTGGDVGLTRVEEFEILGQDEEVLGPVIPGQRGDDLSVRGLAATIPVLGERLRVSLPGDDVPQDPQPGDSADIADDERELEIHLYQGLLHALDVGAGALHEGLPMSEIRPQGDDAVDWTE